MGLDCDRAWRTGALLALLVVAACDEAAPPVDSEPAADTLVVSPSAPDSLTDEERAAIHALGALGYVGGTVEADPEWPTGVTVHDALRVQPGYNLLVSAHGNEVVLLDMRGKRVHRWRCEFDSIWPRRQGVGAWRKDCFRRARLLPDGGLLAIWEGLGLVKLDRDSNVVWAFDGNAHHDLDVDDRGQVWLLTRRARVLPRFNAGEPILEDFVTVLSPEGEVLRSVSLLKCFENSEHTGPLEKVSKGGDVFHTNSLELLRGDRPELLPAFAAGNVLVSLRRSHTIAVVDVDARSVTWSLTGDWRLQHEPVLLDDGRMLLFDNRGVKRRSGVLELDPSTGEVLWEYRLDEKDAFYTATCGVAQRLPNGNTLIAETEPGRAFEITREGEVVWRWESPFHWADEEREYVAAVFDMVRIPAEFVEPWLAR